ncbi:S2-RNase [Pyrus ussuriensis x Pyrus communis]|uniref:S2-RNase n=1 Tax=Pyrus ussuriensis x Pyrus communis TaxID=2448454 RepID=A0A5N5F2W7_9ROSA|nr:S2-RNase [Pyrus ussuriensis x Pyrus communis]
MSTLQEDHEKLLEEEFHEIKHMEFLPPQYLLDEISDLEAEQEECNIEDNPAPDTPGESSTTFKRKDVPKED